LGTDQSGLFERPGEDSVVRRLHLLGLASRLLGTSEDLDVLLDRILEAVEEIFGLDTSAVLLFDDERDVLRIARSRGYDEDIVATFRARRGEGITGIVAETGEPTLVADVTKDPRYQGGAKDSRVEIAAPLRAGGQVIGVLDAESRRLGAFGDTDVELFSAFAAHAALAVHMARTRETLEEQNRLLERRARHLTTLIQVSRALSAELDESSLLTEILRLAREALDIPRCAVLLVDAKGDLVVRASLSYGRVDGMRIPHGEGITGTVAKTQEPVLVGDVSKDERFVPGEIMSGCEMAAPMLFRGELIGVLDAASPVPWAFSQRDLELLAGFAASAAIALRNAKRFGEERASSRPPET
jgi:GAF domain-containing protein